MCLPKLSRMRWQRGESPTAAKGSPFLTANAWILVSWGGLVNALGRVGTGMYSDKIGRDNAYTINCLVSAGALFLLSDALLATNKFAVPLPMASLWVLASYWTAQWCIASWLKPAAARAALTSP